MLLLTIWPLFALICLGFALSRIGFPGAGFWPSAERLNYFVLFPALLVGSLVNAPIRDPAILRLGGAAVIVLLLAAFLMALGRRIRPAPAARFGPALQGVVRFNTYLGLAVTTSLLGGAGVERSAIYLAVGVPLVNVLSIMALTEANAFRNPRLLFGTMARNPLIIACVVGIVLALSGVGLPFGTDALLRLLSAASLPIGLLCVGAALQPAAMHRDVGVLVGVSSLRLFGMPLLAAAVAYALGLSGTEALVLVIFSAIPTAPSSYVLTQQMRGDGTLMAGLVTTQTLVAVVTIPIVLWFYGAG